MEEELKKIICDFCNDIKNTFPEYSETVDKYNMDDVIEFCKETYSKLAIEIVYKNGSIFSNDLYLLPNINFKILWNSNISDTTKDTIWKYLQLVLFSFVSNNDISFEETTKFFEKLDKDDFKDKVDEIMKNLKTDSLFENFKLPDEGELDDVFKGLMDSKIGNLAKEIASESFTGDENIENIMNNPTDFMSLVKNVGNKLDSKIKSGEINQNEIANESSKLLETFNLEKMFSSFNMDNIASMANQLNKGGNGKTKFDTNRFKQKTAKETTKERLRRKLEEKKNKK
jgi:hypothetical protein